MLGAPSDLDREQASWELLQAQINLSRAQVAHIQRQSVWEIPRAVAMIALALAAIVVAGHLTDLVFPPRPQQITVHFEQPLAVKLQ